MPLEIVDPDYSPKSGFYTNQNGPDLRSQFSVKGRREYPAAPKDVIWIFTAQELKVVLEGGMPGVRVPNVKKICDNLRNADPDFVDPTIANMFFKAEASMHGSLKSTFPLLSLGDAGDTKRIEEAKYQADKPASTSTSFPPLPQSLKIVEGDLLGLLEGDQSYKSRVIFKYTCDDEKERKEGKEGKEGQEGKENQEIYLQFVYHGFLEPHKYGLCRTPSLCLNIILGPGFGNESPVNIEALNSLYHRHHWMEFVCFKSNPNVLFVNGGSNSKEKNIYAGRFFGIEIEALSDFWLEQVWAELIRLEFLTPEIVSYFKQIVKITNGSKIPCAVEKAKEQEIVKLVATGDLKLYNMVSKLTALILDSAADAALFNRRVTFYPEKSHSRITDNPHLPELLKISVTSSPTEIEFIENSFLIKLIDMLKDKPKFIHELFDKLLKDPKISRLAKHSVVFDIAKAKLKDLENGLSLDSAATSGYGSSGNALIFSPTKALSAIASAFSTIISPAKDVDLPTAAVTSILSDAVPAAAPTSAAAVLERSRAENSSSTKSKKARKGRRGRNSNKK